MRIIYIYYDREVSGGAKIKVQQCLQNIHIHWFKLLHSGEKCHQFSKLKISCFINVENCSLAMCNNISACNHENGAFDNAYKDLRFSVISFSKH